MRRQVFDVLAVGGTMRDVQCVIKTGSPGLSLDTAKQVLTLTLEEKHAAKSMHVGIGGGAANAAVAIARLGLRAGLVSAVGRDEIGEQIIRQLKTEQVDTSLVARIALEQTGVSMILVEESTGAQGSLFVAGANRLLDITEDLQKTFHTTSWLYLTSLGDTREENMRLLLEALEQEETRVAFVPGGGELRGGLSALQPLLKRTELLVMNASEAEALLATDHAASAPRSAVTSRLRSYGPTIVAVTRGTDGADVETPTEQLHVPAVATTVVDTLGAGDAFASTLVAGLLLSKGKIEQAMQYAALNAASVVGSYTAQKGLLSWSMLEERLRRSPVSVRRQSLP